jgi:polyisoprenoid-binding protein YceI
MKRLSLFFSALPLLTAPLSAFADGSLSFKVRLSPAGSFTAKSEKVKGVLLKDGATFTAEKLTVAIDSLRTGINLRDEHVWKHLKHPEIEKVTILNLKGSAGKATADLEVNGVKKPVQIEFQESGQQVIAKFKVSGHEFNLPAVKYLGISVQDEIEIESQMEFAKK